MLTYLPILNSFTASVLRRKWIVLPTKKRKKEVSRKEHVPGLGFYQAGSTASDFYQHLADDSRNLHSSVIRSIEVTA
jgi:hypothetical protein